MKNGVAEGVASDPHDTSVKLKNKYFQFLNDKNHNYVLFDIIGHFIIQKWKINTLPSKSIQTEEAKFSHFDRTKGDKDQIFRTIVSVSLEYEWKFAQFAIFKLSFITTNCSKGIVKFENCFIIFLFQFLIIFCCNPIFL